MLSDAKLFCNMGCCCISIGQRFLNYFKWVLWILWHSCYQDDSVSSQTNAVRCNARVYLVIVLAFSGVYYCCRWLAMSPTDDAATIGHLEKTLGAIKRRTMVTPTHLHLLTRIETGGTHLNKCHYSLTYDCWSVPHLRCNNSCTVW